MRFKRTALALVISALLAGYGSDDAPDIPDFVPSSEEPTPPPQSEPMLAKGDLQSEPSLVEEIPAVVSRFALFKVNSAGSGNHTE